MEPVRATIEIPAEEFSLGQALADLGDYYAELTQFVPTEEQFVPYVWIENGDLSRIEASLQDRSRIERVTKYDERAGRALYEIEWTPPLDDFISILMNSDCLVTEASGTPERWEFELLARDRDALSTFQSACNESDIPIVIRSVLQSEIAVNGRSALTEKQRELILLAYDRGYFDIPREVTVTELAEELDISPTAASKRLRRGMKNVVRHVLRDI